MSTESAGWPDTLGLVAFGLALRGFVRRSEVARLDTEIRMGAYDMAMMATGRRWEADEPGRPRPDGDARFREALKRLAEMALGG